MTTIASTLSRRRALVVAASAVASTSVSGCACLFGIKPVCPESPEVSYPKGPLTIDAHCHVFNGTDLQVRDFLSKVAIQQKGVLGYAANLLAGILQGLNWALAPDGQSELDELKGVAQSLETCARPEVAARVGALRQKAYSVGRGQLRAALRLSERYGPELNAFTNKLSPFGLTAEARARFEVISEIESLPEDVEQYRAMRKSVQPSALSVNGESASGLIHFVLQNFQYRYVSVHDYLRTYDEPGVRVVDLMLPSMVDYDWWISLGGETPTPLAKQVQVMERISVLTGGRVHGFVAYDPLRQVASDLGFGKGDPLAVVKDAVDNRGCVGVKLYPPMGFAPYGNAKVQATKGPHFWARKWLPHWTDRPDLGHLLDGAMSKLLHWCEDNQVPVMAHTNPSNGVTKDFEELAGPSYWEAALDLVPKLRVNFGHFGDTSIVEDGQDGVRRASEFAKLMTAHGSSRPGSFAYADAGYFVEVMNRRPAMLEDLRRLYDDTAPKLDASLASRFLYGTDWEMTLTEGDVNTYMSQFVELFNSMEQRPALQAQGLDNLSSRFFGINAVDFLGLRKGGAARERLDRFYKGNGVPTPDWMSKVDKLQSPFLAG